MRLLIDEHGCDWDEAWDITRNTMAYTNHTLLPEALETWPVSMFRRLLPRLLEIIYEINARFLDEVSQRWPGDNERIRRMSLIQEGGEPMVRMAYLAIVGSFSVNGVAALHSKLLREGLFRDFAELWPEKFNNKTNGVTQRRWLAACNPGLAALISDNIGDGWMTDLDAAGSNSRSLPTTAEFQKQVARRQTQQQGAPCGGDRATRPALAGLDRYAVRRAGQAHSRVQAAAAESAARGASLRPDSPRRRR